MSHVRRINPSEVDVSELVKQVIEGKVRAVHFMGLLYGATLFYDRKLNSLCLQENSILTCFKIDNGSSEKLINKLKEVSSHVDAVVVIS